MALDAFQIVSDIAGLNQALFQVTHGLYVLTSAHDGRMNGQCLDALMQVTNMPPRVALGVGKRTLTHEMIEATGIFVVNVIDREDAGCFECVKHFGLQSGRKVDKFSTCAYERGELAAPVLPCAKAFYECRVEPDRILDLETHTLYVGKVLRAGTRATGEPLTYNEYRKRIKKGS